MKKQTVGAVTIAISIAVAVAIAIGSVSTIAVS